MELLFTSASRALGSAFAPGMMRIFIQSLLLTIAALIAFAMFCTHVFVWAGLHLFSAPEQHAGMLTLLGGAGSAMLAWFLFPGIMPFIISFFDEQIVERIERHDYPALPAPPHRRFWPEFWHDVRFALVAVGLNIAALPLYFFPPLFPLVFYGLNGYLLGKEFFVSVARRHIPLEEARALRRKYRLLIWTAGAMLAVMATLPLLNLLAPFWGIALMAHLYHGLNRNERVEMLLP